MDRRAVSALLAAVAASGCSSGETYFPLESGTSWTYSVRNGFGAEHVEKLTVGRSVAVGSSRGFEVTGPLGSTRWAWRSGTLVVDSFGNCRAIPALPILRTDQSTVRWNGRLITAFGEEIARGKLVHRPEKPTIAGRTYDALCSELTLERPLGTTVLTTCFVKGLGIVRQEQHTRSALDLRIEWVAGPTRR